MNNKNIVYEDRFTYLHISTVLESIMELQSHFAQCFEDGIRFSIFNVNAF